jgi:hypothetical protein
MAISGLAQFASIQTVIVAICFGLVYFTSQFNVSFVNKSYPVYTTACHWDEGVLYDTAGRTLCRERNLFYGCQRLMEKINTNYCDAPPFVHYGDELGEFTQQVTINIIETTTAIGLGLLLVWLLLFVRRWRTAIFNLMVLCHTIASVFAGIYALNVLRAMDQLKKTDNDNTGQIVSIGEGFFTVMVLPPILLVHDLFIQDWIK